jgi:hypothetical protein
MMKKPTAEEFDLLLNEVYNLSKARYDSPAHAAGAFQGMLWTMFAMYLTPKQQEEIYRRAEVLRNHLAT